MKNIVVIGAGKIGSVVYEYLKQTEHKIFLIDDVKNSNITRIDANNPSQLKEFFNNSQADICVSAAPYNVNKNIADVCAETGVAYFDLTEDTEVSQHIKNLNTKTFMMPQCGLAPGAINIIAADLIKQFDTVDKVKMRVGALPMYTTNAMAYYLTWSTSGLINEYVNEVDVISNGQHFKAQPLDGLEQIYIDGDRYEAFNTSGGVATMCETYQNKINSLSYKTIRYPGHQASMKFLLDDLNLKHNKQKFIDLFDQEVPYTTQDVVVILATVVGYINGKYQEKTYSKKIYGDSKHNAIQRTTASGVCSVVLSYADGKIQGEGFQRQEDIALNTFLGNKFGELYG